jgi:hypothetical protein
LEVSQRWSEYARIEGDRYNTPEWVTLALIPHLPRKPIRIWEPAAGEGAMLAPLRTCAPVLAADVRSGDDFLNAYPAPDDVDLIVTNPPYQLAVEFIDRALCLTESRGGMVAMLLRTDFDHARTRQYLFSSCDAFARKLVLTKRIRWIADSTGSPSFNHAWFIWDWQHCGPPTIAYA